MRQIALPILLRHDARHKLGRSGVVSRTVVAEARSQLGLKPLQDEFDLVRRYGIAPAHTSFDGGKRNKTRRLKAAATESKRASLPPSKWVRSSWEPNAITQPEGCGYRARRNDNPPMMIKIGQTSDQLTPMRKM